MSRTLAHHEAPCVWTPVENARDAAWVRPALTSWGLQPSGGDRQRNGASWGRVVGLVVSSEAWDGVEGGWGRRGLGDAKSNTMMASHGQNPSVCQASWLCHRCKWQVLTRRGGLALVYRRPFMSFESEQSAGRVLVKGSGLEIGIIHRFMGKTGGAGWFFALGRESLGRREGREGGPRCWSAEEHSQPGAGRTQQGLWSNRFRNPKFHNPLLGGAQRVSGILKALRRSAIKRIYLTVFILAFPKLIWLCF